MYSPLCTVLTDFLEQTPSASWSPLLAGDWRPPGLKTAAPAAAGPTQLSQLLHCCCLPAAPDTAGTSAWCLSWPWLEEDWKLELSLLEKKAFLDYKCYTLKTITNRSKQNELDPNEGQTKQWISTSKDNIMMPNSGIAGLRNMMQCFILATILLSWSSFKLDKEGISKIALKILVIGNINVKQGKLLGLETLAVVVGFSFWFIRIINAEGWFGRRQIYFWWISGMASSVSSWICENIKETAHGNTIVK